MTRTHVLALTAAASLTGMAGLDLLAVDAKPVSYELPAENAALKPGPTSSWFKATAPGAIRSTISRPSRAGRSSRKTSGKRK